MKEINRYRLALLQYRLSNALPKFIFKTELGFCRHFNCKSLDEDFKVLYSIAPFIISGKYRYLKSYWFGKGKLQPRINLLKQAIKICKEQAITQSKS